MSDDRLANMFYGNTTPAPAAAREGPLDELAKKFYPDAPAPAAAPDSPTSFDEQTFDRYKAFRTEFEKDAEALHNTLGVSSASRESEDRAFVKLADSIGLDDFTMLALHSQIVSGLVQSVAPNADGDADETAVMQARNVEIRQTLRDRLGEAAADDLMARTERFIDSTPDLEHLVNRGALATRADVFLTIAQHVHDKRIR